jgi:hypothetical protein
MTRHPIRSRQATIVVACALIVSGSWLLWDGFERRGRARPWGARLLPGV